MEYVISFKGKFLWKKIKVIGHKLDKETDKMVLYYQDGTIREIPHWSTKEVYLGTDWLLAMKKSMEEKAGQSVPVRGT